MDKWKGNLWVRVINDLLGVVSYKEECSKGNRNKDGLNIKESKFDQILFEVEVLGDLEPTIVNVADDL